MYICNKWKKGDDEERKSRMSKKGMREGLKVTMKERKKERKNRDNEERKMIITNEGQK